VETLTKFRTFLQESWQEVRYKVTWPTKQEVWGTTVVVLITTLAFAMVLFVLDSSMAWAIKKVFDQFRVAGMELVPVVLDAIA
jgi:preprotein translocase subunit SecE